MATPFIGEIRLLPYTFEPRGWMFCHGQLLAISQNDALFALIGTTYGGDGQNTFGLPDLRGRVIVGQQSTSPQYTMGQIAGEEQVTLLSFQIPAHTHDLAVSNADGTSADPSGKFLGNSTLSSFKPYGLVAGVPLSAAPAESIQPTGSSQPHENMMPYLALNYCIAIEGVYPPRN